MGIVDRIAARFGYQKAGSGAQRGFAGAQIGRLTASWVTQSTHVNRDLQNDLRVLRARSRQLAQDNDYGKKFLSLVRTNVVGHSGFSLQVQALRPDGSIDQLDSDKLEQSFKKWSRPGVCDVTGRLSFAELQRLFIRTVACDGEVFVREVSRGPFAYQLELIDPSLIDERYNDDRPGGVKIRMGVEVDGFGAPQAYWLNSGDASDPKYYGYQVGNRIRIPASEMRHYFISEGIRQLRGIPWMGSAMLRMNMLGGYEEAAVIAARVGAAKLGVIESPDGDPTPFATAQADDGTPQIDSKEPGEFFSIAPGQKLSSWSPEYPHAQYGAFVKSCLRGVSSGLGVAYNTLANDLEGVNYSSIRAGVLEEREVWKAIQAWMIETFLAPTYTRWLERAILSGAVALPMSKFEKFDAAIWQGRRWAWVDPRNDIEANISAIETNQTSVSQVIRETGRDPEEVWREIAAERKRFAELGIQPAPRKPAAPDPAQQQTDSQGNAAPAA